MINEENFESYFLSSLQKWYFLIRRNNYTKAIEIARNNCALCRKILLESRRKRNSFNNSILLIGILFKALWEFSDLYHITKSKKWIHTPKMVETVWILTQNCTDRLTYIKNFITLENDINNFIDSVIKHANSMISEKYGDGYYSSPEIRIKKAICSVCKADYRKCPHLPNNIYDGKICAIVPQEIEFNGMALVDHPKDLRCRIWPWNIEETSEGRHLKNVVCVVSFNMEDFLED